MSYGKGRPNLEKIVAIRLIPEEKNNSFLALLQQLLSMQSKSNKFMNLMHTSLKP